MSKNVSKCASSKSAILTCMQVFFLSLKNSCIAFCSLICRIICNLCFKHFQEQNLLFYKRRQDVWGFFLFFSLSLLSPFLNVATRITLINLTGLLLLLFKLCTEKSLLKFSTETEKVIN